jgi:tetratricopeptide (TPR) repeat protein
MAKLHAEIWPPHTAVALTGWMAEGVAQPAKERAIAAEALFAMARDLDDPSIYSELVRWVDDPARPGADRWRLLCLLLGPYRWFGNAPKSFHLRRWLLDALAVPLSSAAAASLYLRVIAADRVDSFDLVRAELSDGLTAKAVAEGKAGLQTTRDDHHDSLHTAEALEHDLLELTRRGWLVRDGDHVSPGEPAPLDVRLGDAFFVDPNTATEEQIARLPSISARLAAGIVAARPHTTIDDLTSVAGLGAVRVGKLRPWLTGVELGVPAASAPEVEVPQAKLWHEAGEVRAKAAEWSRAARAFEAAVAVAPARGNSWFRLGVAREKLGEVDAAAAAYARTTELLPRAWNAWYKLGGVERQRGNGAEALAALRTSTELAPSKGLAWRERASAHADVGEHVEAVAAAQKAYALKRNDPVAILLLARCLAAADRADEAVALIEPIAVRVPSWTAGWVYLGRLHHQLGDHARAIATCTEGLKHNESSAILWMNRGCSRALAGDRGGALADLQRALTLRPALAPKIRADRDLASLRDDPGFAALLASLGA